MNAIALRQKLVDDLKADLKDLATVDTPLRVVGYFLRHRRDSKLRELVLEIRDSAFPEVADILTRNLSEFCLLLLSQNPVSFEDRLVIRAGSHITASILKSAIFRKPFSIAEYLFQPIGRGFLAAWSMIRVEEDAADAFIAEHAPQLANVVKQARNWDMSLSPFGSRRDNRP
jgi:hypothetical protein